MRYETRPRSNYPQGEGEKEKGLYYNLDMSKKVVYFLVILISAILILGGFFYLRNWWNVRQIQIKLGLAESKFPYRVYTQEELNKMYPQIKNADVPTRITPEQTYVKFREALKTNNLQMAIEQLSQESEKYEENKKTLEQAHGDGKFAEAFKEYPEKIEKESMYDVIASYYYFRRIDGENAKTHISFIKDANGDWKIDIF